MFDNNYNKIRKNSKIQRELNNYETVSFFQNKMSHEV